MQTSPLALLKAVSRSFYLSVRILPKNLRHTIALTYLVARAADTIADTKIIPTDERLAQLNLLRVCIESGPKAELTVLTSIGEKLGKHAHHGEKILLQDLQEILEMLWLLPPAHLKLAQKVLGTLTEGMVEDLNFFKTSGKDITCLEHSRDTERYTYLVAGCVGEFWTGLLIEEKLCKWNRDEMVAIGVRFGQGLQWINILRDLPRDLKNHRCYLSHEDLEEHGLKPKDLANLENSPEPETLNKLGALYRDKILMTRSLLASGIVYTRAIPRHLLNLRLAVLWPLLIGLGTLRALEKSGYNMWQKDRPIKMTRSAVYGMMVVSFLLSPLNSLLYGLYRRRGGLAL